MSVYTGSLSWKWTITCTWHSGCFRKQEKLPVHTSACPGGWCHRKQDWATGSTGAHRLNHITHSSPPTAMAKMPFAFFSHIKGIVLGSEFKTKRHNYPPRGGLARWGRERGTWYVYIEGYKEYGSLSAYTWCTDTGIHVCRDFCSSAGQ